MPQPAIKPTTLNREESRYVLRLIADDLVYYKLLIGNPECSEKHQHNYDLVNGIINKLEVTAR